ncbi:MAG: hypothetical protein KDH96_00395 [Candidatus Riesia sp.]|nr:hypothetical protein [Candidatus Riesia sp.]
MKRWYYYLKGLLFGKKIYLQFNHPWFKKGDIVVPNHLKRSNLRYFLKNNQYVIIKDSSGPNFADIYLYKVALI